MKAFYKNTTTGKWELITPNDNILQLSAGTCYIRTNSTQDRVWIYQGGIRLGAAVIVDLIKDTLTNTKYVDYADFDTVTAEFISPQTGGGVSTSEDIVEALGYVPFDLSNGEMNDGDLNSLICGDITQDNWNDYSTSYKPKIVLNHEAGLVYINPYGDAPMYAQKAHRFLSPQNCTSVRFSIEAKKPSDIGSSSVEMCILSANGSSVIASRVVALTNTLTAYELDATVTADTEYYCSLFFNNASVTQSRVIMKNPTLKGLNGDEFVGNWNRITVLPKLASHNINTNYDNAVHAYSLNPFASVSYITNSNSVCFEFVSTNYTSFPQYANVGLFVNDKFHSSLSVAANYKTKRTKVDLDSGIKKITIVCSNKTQTYGSWVRALYFEENSLCVNVKDSRPNVVLYGDSIVSGANAANQFTQSFAMLLRQYLSGSVVIEANGYRSLHDDANTDALRIAFVAKIAKANPVAMLIAIGTNDYGLNKWSAASFGTAYAALLDDLHASIPNLKIFCQTPIIRSVETANSFGNTTDDYRTQISNSVATRTDYCTLIDGKNILLTTDLDDGVHPKSIAHAGKYFTALYDYIK